MTIRVRAPATTANLGAGFDVAGAALTLWNELEVRDEGGEVDETHLGVRAYAIYASPAGHSFDFLDRIPRERGLGSSAAVVALGLVAGAAAAASSRPSRSCSRRGSSSRATPTTSRRRSPAASASRTTAASSASPTICRQRRSQWCRKRA